MAFDINEARAIIEAAKKRGLIRPPGDNSAPASPPGPTEQKPNISALPDWLQNGINAPPAAADQNSPMWRSE